MRNNDFADRRIFGRVPTMVPVRLLVSGRDKECHGQTVDISANGIGVVSKEKLPPQTPLELWLDLPDNRGPFYTRGEVVWSKPLTKIDEQRSGIRLEKAELMGLAPLLWK